jgi:hypothetical protein
MWAGGKDVAQQWSIRSHSHWILHGYLPRLIKEGLILLSTGSLFDPSLNLYRG